MPDTPKNKVKYGLRNVYYAVAAIAADGSATFGTPVAIPGAVSLSLDAEGEITPFRADNIDYWTASSNNGYSGDFELALIPESFKTDVLNMVKDSKGVLYETTTGNPTHFALLFQFEGDVKATKHVMYNCVATRPSVSGETTPTGGIEPQTETLNITAASIYVSSLGVDIVKASTTEDGDTTTYNGWTSAVYVPAAAATT